MNDTDEKLVRRFNGDLSTKKAVLEYLNYYIREYSADKVLSRGDVTGIADAKDIIEKAFTNLEIIYGIPERQQEPSNTAR